MPSMAISFNHKLKGNGPLSRKVERGVRVCGMPQHVALSVSMLPAYGSSTPKEGYPVHSTPSRS